MNAEILGKISEVLGKYPEIKIAVLYGSFAKGTEKPTSDIDLAIAAADKLSPDQLVGIQTALSNKTGREIDLIDLNTASGTVFHQALTTGVTLLKVDDSLYAQILNRMLFEEADFEIIRKRILAERRKQVLG